MKLLFTITMVAAVMVLGCAPTPKAEPETKKEAQPEATFDEAMANYTSGEWIENYDAALAAAVELKRPILVNFTGSDWCSWCKKLSAEVFTQDQFKDYAKSNLVLLKLDYPRSIPQTAELKAQNDKLQKQFKIEGYPTIVLLNGAGVEINRLGYEPGGAAAYVNRIKTIVAPK